MTVRGVDLSHHQSTVNFDRIAEAKFRFVYLKATEGTGYEDPTFHDRRKAARAAGLLVGAYHFAHPGNSPTAEADHFLNVIGRLRDGDLPPALDLEVTDGQDWAAIRAWAHAWLGRVAKHTGDTPTVYLNTYFSQHVGQSLAKWPLWVASYRAGQPVFAGWRDWTFWQYTDKGNVPGVGGGVDCDLFNGSLRDLRRLAKVHGEEPHDEPAPAPKPAPAPTPKPPCNPWWRRWVRL